ncbi:F0F1 ATP synthase subunit A [Aliifodinibius sp. S!AR15-10]|uniref:F0F1 ATP synthase subunit A n=1 Tax=Aliifodinibius sp. S!AR15-10 TaxID=2950437 RepID=UPI002859FD71|nr:F0F1 ATP synthase subunit A [Aliifodinibius sp. S!AR15-10]MDR8393260.1 F0F1 ATP synthase subunit A [Aliifodinibius sp. S!AR15-10]
MEFNADNIVYWEWEFIAINATLVYSWVVIGILSVGAWAVTSRIDPATSISRWQHMLEAVVALIREQIREASRQEPDRYLPFVGTLFLFIVVSNVIDVIPGFMAPTTSLSTTAALATLVFCAVPVFGIMRQGWKGYLGQYLKPTPFMLPFNIIGEISRTVALAIRLFGNIMSGSLIVAILLSLAPLFFPVAMQAFGLLIGVIQAYVFAILALVYIASGQRSRDAEVQIEQSNSSSTNKSNPSEV